MTAIIPYSMLHLQSPHWFTLKPEGTALYSGNAVKWLSEHLVLQHAFRWHSSAPAVEPLAAWGKQLYVLPPEKPFLSLRMLRGSRPFICLWSVCNTGKKALERTYPMFMPQHKSQIHRVVLCLLSFLFSLSFQ